MTENINNSFSLCEGSESPSESLSSQVRDLQDCTTRALRERGRSLPLFEVLNLVKSQIEFDLFNWRESETVSVLALYIAEVIKLPPTASVRIDGNDLPAEMVAEVYGYITNEHIHHVLEKYADADYEIKHTKTYLRTMLYNSVFELVLQMDNQNRANLW